LTIKQNVPQGLTEKQIIKNGSKLVTITGTVAQINSTLSDTNAVTYSRDKDFKEKDSLAITASDGKKNSTKTISLTLIPSNSPPILSISESITTENGITITKREAINVIQRYLVAKARIFAPPYDRQLAQSLTSGKTYEDIIKSEGSLDWLQRNNAYYIFGKQAVEPLTYFSASGNQVEIDVKVIEEYSYYKDGTLNLSDTINRNYRFTLQLEDGVWKIAERKSLSNLGDGE
jgi:serine/threonine-protein kinase